MFGVFDHIFMFAETYATLFFAVIALLTIDVAIFSIDLEVKSIREQKAEMEEKRLESLRKSSRAVSVKKKFNPFENRGFAYSSAPGNDKLVTDSLANRLREALASKLLTGIAFDMKDTKKPVEPLLSSKDTR